MFVIVGYIVVIGSVLGGYALAGGHMAALLQPIELLMIGGAALGAFRAEPGPAAGPAAAVARAGRSQRHASAAGPGPSGSTLRSLDWRRPIRYRPAPRSRFFFSAGSSAAVSPLAETRNRGS